MEDSGAKPPLKVSIGQPAYIPYLGYFERLNLSDVHVVYDHVLFDRYWFMHRNKVRTPSGWVWLTVPIRSGKGKQLVIKNAKIDNSKDWQNDHLSKLKKWYSRSYYFDEIYPIMEDYYACKKWLNLVDLTDYFRRVVCCILDINVRIVHSSEMDIRSASSDGVLETCENVGAVEYISGKFGKDYLDLDKFNDAGIKVTFHEFEPEVYPQAYRGFEPNMSILDALFNLGVGGVKQLLEEK